MEQVRNEVLLRVKEQRNILDEISKRKANRIGHILRRNCLLQQVIEGKIKGGIESGVASSPLCGSKLVENEQVNACDVLIVSIMQSTISVQPS
jgi:hypothetical protein